MSKDATLRINDTLQFIQNTTVVTAPERPAARQLAQDFITARYPPAHAGQQAYTNFSNQMSLGFHLSSDPNDRRKMCRAIFLLWHAMNHKDYNFTVPVQNASQINQGTAPRLLENVMRKARVMQEAPGSTAGLSHVLTNVIPNNPLAFLQDNKFIVLGSKDRSATQGERNVLPAEFFYNPLHDRWDIQVTSHPQAGRFVFQA